MYPRGRNRYPSYATISQVKQQALARFDAARRPIIEWPVTVENLGTETATFQIESVLGAGASIDAIRQSALFTTPDSELVIAGPGIWNVELPGTPAGATPVQVNAIFTLTVDDFLFSQLFAPGVNQVVFDYGVRIGSWEAGDWIFQDDSQLIQDFIELAIFEAARIVEIGDPVQA
jgi:hypothetical protein